jgi:Amt family ammonium transporter
VSFMAQLVGSAMGVPVALVGGFVVYGTLKAMVGIQLDQEQEFEGPDLSMHRISASPRDWVNAAGESQAQSFDA